VLVELDTATLHARRAPVQRDRRATLLARLRAYRDAGAFPHNYDFPGRAVPYFVDRETGTLCAVAHLLASTGRRDIVDRVTRADNNVWVAALAEDTAFTAWLSANGLTLAEAVRIQMPYAMAETPAQAARNRAFMVAAPTTFAAAAITSMWNALGNADGHGRAGSVIGIASGLGAIAGGGLVTFKSGVPQSLGVASVLVGGTSVALGVRSLRRHGAAIVAAREAEQTRAAAVSVSSVSPVITTNAGAGLAVSLRF
jgi:hypothetical protein